MQNQGKSKYAFIWSNYQADFTVEMNINSLIKYPEIDWNRMKNIIEVSRNNKISAYYSKKDLENNEEREKKLLEKEYFKKLIKDMEEVCGDYQKMFGELRDIDYSELSNKELYNWFVRMTDMWSLMMGYFIFSQAEGTYYLVEEIRLDYIDKHPNIESKLSINYQHNPHYTHSGLQIADYIAYAVFQVYENNNRKWYELVNNKVGKIQDICNKKYFTRSNPL